MERRLRALQGMEDRVTTTPETVVLEAKLHPPILHTEHLSRRRLLARLDSAADRQLTLVEAPAGWGKSTLLAEWCAAGAGGRPVAWLSLDEGDNDPVVLWRYVLHALRRLEPECFGAGLSLLAQPGVGLTRAVLPALLNELWSLDTPLVLVLDDYHQLTEPDCHDSLGFFLRRLPRAMHLVIVTRTEPPLGLGALRARGELAQLRAADLRFTTEEAAGFLTERLGLPLTSAEVERLAERTEGWAAGLYLGALSLREQPDTAAFIATFAGSHRHIVEFLGGEVLDRLTDAERDFLLHTSVLDRFSAPLCDAVTEGTDAAAQLAELERTNQFLIPLDARRTQYRYHHLFQELLQVELERTQPQLLPVLHRRAAAWYRAAGNVDAAMRHALAADDFGLAGRLFVEHWRHYQATGRLATVEEWLEQIPDTAIAASASLALNAATVAAMCRRQQADVERYLALGRDGEVEGPLPLNGRSVRSAEALLRASFPYGDVGLALSEAEAAVAEETDPGRHAYIIARSALGRALYLRGRPKEARAPLEEAIRAPLAQEQPLGRIIALAILALVSMQSGEMGRAEGLSRRATAEMRTAGLADHPSLWFVPVATARVLLRQGHVEEAESVLAESLEPRLHTLRSQAVSYAEALLTLAPVRYARGHTHAARSLLEEARLVIAGCIDPGILPAMLSETERLHHRVPRRPDGLAEHLTEAELRVLRLLPSDLSQREIGRELYLSLNTVRTHIRVIYGKLDAASRAEAVARARSLDLFV